MSFDTGNVFRIMGSGVFIKASPVQGKIGDLLECS